MMKWNYFEEFEVGPARPGEGARTLNDPEPLACFSSIEGLNKAFKLERLESRLEVVRTRVQKGLISPVTLVNSELQLEHFKRTGNLIRFSSRMDSWKKKKNVEKKEEGDSLVPWDSSKEDTVEDPYTEDFSI